MNNITQIRMNHARLEKGARYRITDRAPVFSWAVQAQHKNAVQEAYSLQIECEDVRLFDSGWVLTESQQVRINGISLPIDRPLTVTVRVRDNLGDESKPYREVFYAADPSFSAPKWIAASTDEPGKVVYFRRNFAVSGTVRYATLYICGLGYHKVYLNGNEADKALLDPLHSDYTASCYFTVLPELQHFLHPGDNCLAVAVGEGWRRAKGVCTVDPNLDTVHFFGQPQLSACLRINYADGSTEMVTTDNLWNWTHGAITQNDLFNGETYDAEKVVPEWNRCGCSGVFSPVTIVKAPGGVARINTVQPIAEQDVLTPQAVIPLDSDTYLVDFGVNIAGVCRLNLPNNMKPGQRITVAHAEMLRADGRIFSAPNRSAAQTDTYIAAGNEFDLSEWQPQFTYHGFRYAQVTGYPFLNMQDIRAVSMHTDIVADSYFVCGNPLVNAIQNAVLRTEKNNIHGILTDCPQRDERMGWMNDATVRFEETPYNFHVGRLFPKVVQDILDTQQDDGSITCTAPHVFGCRPADPVCSSFLIAGLESMLHEGDIDTIRTAYDGFLSWQKCLAAHTEGDIVNYSYYGDWAGPEYACLMPEWPYSAVTPGEFISTGYYYYNALLLARFADLLGMSEESALRMADAERIRNAMLARFCNGETGVVATGSQGCQSFALWLGILPENQRPLAAKRLHDDLVENNYRITTGNLCTRYLFDVLTENGYLEDAWTLITRNNYPSIGYMLQNEATTIWERFELKDSSAMNSHDHPMYGAVGYWFYAYLAGIRPISSGYDVVEIRPFFPQKLLSVNAAVDTPKGLLTVRWVRRYGKRSLYVSVPFGVKAQVIFDGKVEVVGSGYHFFVAVERTEISS